MLFDPVTKFFPPLYPNAILLDPFCKFSNALFPNAVLLSTVLLIITLEIAKLIGTIIGSNAFAHTTSPLSLYFTI